MSWLSRHQKVASVIYGKVGKFSNTKTVQTHHILHLSNRNCLVKLQTMKPYAYHQQGDVAMAISISVSEPSWQYASLLGSLQKFKACLYQNSKYKTSFCRAQTWNSVKVAEFSTQVFQKSASQFRPDTFRGYTYRQFSASQAEGKKSQATLLYLLALVVAMVGSTYAAVPLYRKFCQATGYGGTVQRRETVEEKIARHAQEGTKASRELVIQFNADVADGMPWTFVPAQREVRVKPGESALAFYIAQNFSPKAITGVSTYNVTPMKAAIYFNKIQCFCFEEQQLLPGEKIDMPVFFYVDPEFDTDPKMNGINNLILSYTFFKVEDEET